MDSKKLLAVLMFTFLYSGTACAETGGWIIADATLRVLPGAIVVALLYFWYRRKSKGHSTETKKKSALAALMAFAIYFVPMTVVATINIGSAEDKGLNAPQAATAPPQEPVKQQIAKKDGTFDERPNDLDELCKDWVYWKAKTYKHGREGNQEEAQKARAEFQKVNVWLEEYRNEDVARVCQQYDTKENLVKYMR